MITFHAFMAARGFEKPFGGYRSRFGFIWWFWVPRLHTQRPNEWNPCVIRVIWLCFAAGIEVWTKESNSAWPDKQQNQAKEAKP